MSYPAGVTTRPVSFGPAIILEDGTPLEMEVTVRASRSLVWLATGAPFVSLSTTLDGDQVETQLPLPVTDQSGYGDGKGNAIDVADGKHSHYYTATVAYKAKGRVVKQVSAGPFALPEDDGSPIDLDNLIPVSTAGGATIAIPDTWSATLDEARTMLEQKGAPGGLAPLNESGELPEDNVPERLSETSLTATIATATEDKADLADVETLEQRRARFRRENPPRWTQTENGLGVLTSSGLVESGGRINAAVAGTNGDAIVPMWGAAKDFRASFIVKATKSVAGSRGGVGFVVSAEGKLPAGTGPTTAGTYVAGYMQGTGIAIVRDHITTPHTVLADGSLVDGKEYRITVVLNDRAARATGQPTGGMTVIVTDADTGAFITRSSTGYTLQFYTPRNVLIRTNQGTDGPRDIEIVQHNAGPFDGSNTYFGMNVETRDGGAETSFIRIPKNPNGKVVLALHGHGSSVDTTGWVDGALTPTWQALENAGYTIGVPDMGGNLWGNDLALARTVDLFRQLTTYYDLDPNSVYLWGNSMGAGAAATIIAKGLLPVRAAYLAQPAVDYDTIRANPAFSTIVTAYPTVAEQDDNNPLKQAGAAYAGVPLMIVASTGDTTISKAGNADALAALAGPHALVRQFTVTGNHNDASHYRPVDTLNWFRANA